MAYGLAPDLLMPVTTSKSFYKEKGSKFWGFLFPAVSQQAVKECLGRLQQEHPDATHICYAWRMGEIAEHTFTQDDGEPAHTAGAPILRAIRAAKINNVLIAVARYYGGTKLGVPGLIEAYQTTANEAIKQATLEPFCSKTVVEIQCDYAQESKIRSLIAHCHGTVLKAVHHTTVLITAQLNTSELTQFLAQSPCYVQVHGRLF